MEIYEFNYGIKTGRPKTEKITTHVCAPAKGREEPTATLQYCKELLRIKDIF